MNGFGKPFDDAPAEPFQQRAGNRPPDHHCILVAPQPIHFGFAIADLLENVSAFANSDIADEMAVVIVDQLETVEVDHRQCHFVALPVFVTDVEMERAAIGQQCQAVAARELFDAAQMADGQMGADRRRHAEQDGTDDEDRGRRCEVEEAIGNGDRPGQDETPA